MKKQLLFFLYFLCLTLFPPASHANSVVKVAIYNNAPLISIDPDDRGKGVFADIIEYVASQEGWQIEYVPGTWQECLSRLENKEVDILSSIAFSSARDERYDFTRENILTNWGQIYTPRRSGIKAITDLAGKNIAILKGDIYSNAFDRIIKAFGIKGNIIYADDYQDILELISRRQVDAGILNRFYGLKNADAYQVEKSGIIFNPIKIHYAVPEGENQTLISAIDTHIKQLKETEDSIYYASLEKWFGAVSTHRIFPKWVKWSLMAAIGLIVVLFLVNMVLRTQGKATSKALVKELIQREQAESDLQEAYNIINRSNSVAFLWQNSDGWPVEFVSDNVRELFGFSAGEFTSGQIIYEKTIHPDDLDRVTQEVLRASRVKNRISFGHEPYRIISKDGTVKWVDDRTYIRRDDQGKITHYEGIVVDITDRRQSEKEKIDAQKVLGEQKKLSLIGQIAGKMSHDFNNILGIIMGNTELLIMDCEDAEQKSTLELILKQTMRGKNLTKNLVAFAKDQTPKQEFFKIKEKIDLVVNLMKRDLEGVVLEREYEAELPELLADPGMIEHALVNLVQNAIHAVSRTDHPKIVIRAYGFDDRICMEIEDNGCGIPEESVDHIYDPSFTLKGSKDVTGSYNDDIKGTGYGMSNVKKYIEQHTGNIFVASTPGAGTKFTIHLPVTEKKTTTGETKEVYKTLVQSEKYILVVEDEAAISNVQYRMLSQSPLNHRIDIADTGQAAIEMLDKNEYDFVSLDYVLPGGINGMDVYHHIRQTHPLIPVLFISGNIEFLESIKELKQKDKKIDHLSKPIQNRDYINCINQLLAVPPAEK